MHMVPASSRGVDASFARPPGPRLVELGCDFLVGYLSVLPASPKKNLTKAECANYLLYICLLLVWEMSAARANLGAVYGTLDGVNARREAAARDYPTDVPILVADDTNTTPANIAAQEAYMRAFAAACAPYPIGIYGDVDILYRCADLWQIGWLPNAWSWSGGSRAIAEATAKALGAQVLQHTGFYIDNTWAVDPNDVIAPFPAWSLTPDVHPDIPSAPVLEIDMAVPLVTGPTPGGTVYLLRPDDGFRRQVSPQEFRSYNQAPTVLSDAELAAIPEWVNPGPAVPVVPVVDYDRLAAAIAPLLPHTFDGTIHVTAAG